MELSIIIVNYKTFKLTLDCLKSLDNYPYEHKFEVIVVDNASEDGSIEKIAKYKPKKFDLKTVKNKNNLGFSKANNIGIKKSHGKYVILLNSDTKVLKGSLDELVEFASTHKQAGVVAPKLLNPDKSVQPSVFRLPSLSRAFSQYILGAGKVLDKYAPQGSTPLEVECVVGACFLITPQAREKVGILNERYFMYFEDFDYCREVLRTGLKIYYLPEVKIVHIHGGSGGGSDAQFKRLVAASKIYHGTLKHSIIQLMIKIGRRMHAKD